MEALQPAGSFKLRGIGHLCQKRVAAGAKRLIASSGGNAGYAAAYAARRLGVGATVVVPESTSKLMREKIEAESAHVLVWGGCWDEADLRARELAAAPGCAYVPPFDHPDLWEGHASLVDELAAQHDPFGLVVLAVGGGGLLCGVLTGLHRVGWQHVPVLAVETEGTSSFDAACRAGRLVTLEAIQGVATSLGAKTVAAEAVAWNSRHEIHRHVVSDREAVGACQRFADDHRILVEPACGASLATVYGCLPELARRDSVLVVVCGGAGVNLQQFHKWLSILQR